jgi:hypothetical protein
MPADIINLRAARKAKARAGAEAKAEQNRALFGRTKAEKARDKDAKARLASHLEGHRLEPWQTSDADGKPGKPRS